MTPRLNVPPWIEPPPPGLRVWAVEPYFGGSHRQFLEGWQAAGEHQVQLHTLPGRHWKWRMHGGALRLAEEAEHRLGEGEFPPQVVFASGMLDVPTYLMLAPPEVLRAPCLLYMHENQLTYPLPPGVERDLTYGVRQLAGAAAAERLLFNSEFHCKEFLQACSALLDEVPDEPPRAIVDAVVAKAKVLPLGLDLRRFDQARPARAEAGGNGVEGGISGGSGGSGGQNANAKTAGKPPLILWNQRWEYDKAPGDFFRALYALQELDVDFRVAVAGPNRGLPTREFVEARERLGPRVVHWGMAQSFAEYAELLWSADLVVSTALHEFFGAAVCEAIYCGCRPLLPDRLSYPELIPLEAHGEVLYQEGGLVPLLERALREGRPWSEDWQRTWVSRYDWGVMAPRYDSEVWSAWEEGTRRAGFGSWWNRLQEA